MKKQCDMRTFVNSLVSTVNALLLLLGLSTARDVKLCANDSILELTAGLNISIICKAERDVHWRLHVVHRGTNASFNIANCSDKGCTLSPFFPETFSASVKNNHTKLIIINTENNTKIYDNVQLVNGFLECISVNNVHVERSARCGLNYVYPSENVYCEGVTTSGTLHVSCVIGSVYSSRGIYRCQLFSQKHWNKSLETVDMVTTPTNERITKNEVKVSGSCQFNTTLLPEEECHDIFVSVSPGGRNYSVNLIGLQKPDHCVYVTQDQERISADITGGVIAAVVVVILAVVYIVVSRQQRYAKESFVAGRLPLITKQLFSNGR